MSVYTIFAPSTDHSTEYWSNFINSSLEYLDSVSHLVVDFNSVRFLNTDDLVMLACLIETFYIRNVKISFIRGSIQLNSYLNNIRFKEYWQDGFDRESFTSSKNSTTLCLWKISRKMTYQYSIYARDYFNRTFLNGKDLLSLSSNLDEVFNNIFDHSKSLVGGYIMTQYFPNVNKLSFAVCDFGIGIPNCINDFRKRKSETVIKDSDALKEALKLGFSVKSTPQNRGFGLNNVIDFVNNSNGEIDIISNFGILSKRAQSDFETYNAAFFSPGTMIKVSIDTTTFEMIEEDEVFDF